MKKIVLFQLSILLCLCCLGGCGKQSENTDEKRSLDEYVESVEGERFGEEVSFKVTGRVDHMEPPDPYYNTNEDGSIDLFLSVTTGTPYSIEGPIYDHDMFTMKKYVKNVQGRKNNEGSGSVTCLYRFFPIQSGDTEIVMLNRYFVDDVYQGTVYNITVEDDLKCRMNWYGGVKQGENLKINGLSD